MIQRIQSIYLLIVTALLAVTCFKPIAFFSCEAGVYNLTAMGLVSATGEASESTLYLFVLLALSALLPFVTIFLFKNRMLQVRLCIAEMVLILGALIVMGIYFYLGYRTTHEVEFLAYGITPWIGFPFAALIFDYLAMRAIFKDEALVRSLDRIR